MQQFNTQIESKDLMHQNEQHSPVRLLFADCSILTAHMKRNLILAKHIIQIYKKLDKL